MMRSGSKLENLNIGPHESEPILITHKQNGGEAKKKRTHTPDSNVVPHRSTNEARMFLTSVIGREQV